MVYFTKDTIVLWVVLEPQIAECCQIMPGKHSVCLLYFYILFIKSTFCYH